MHQLQRSWVRSQYPSAQWNLRGGRWSSAEYNTKKIKKIPPPPKKKSTQPSKILVNAVCRIKSKLNLLSLTMATDGGFIFRESLNMNDQMFRCVSYNFSAQTCRHIRYKITNAGHFFLTITYNTRTLYKYFNLDAPFYCSTFCSFYSFISINVPVVYMARRGVMILMGENPFWGPLEGVDPVNRDFVGLRNGIERRECQKSRDFQDTPPVYKAWNYQKVSCSGNHCWQSVSLVVLSASWVRWLSKKDSPCSRCSRNPRAEDPSGSGMLEKGLKFTVLTFCSFSLLTTYFFRYFLSCLHTK